MNKLRLAVISIFCGHGAFAATDDVIVTLGDSLTFAYEAEFGFQINIPLNPPFGDGFGPEVRNWIEILNSPDYRGGDFNIGDRKSINIGFPPFVPTQNLLFRHEHNWAIPGLRVAGLREFISGEASFLEIIGATDGFSELGAALEASDFDEEEDFALAELEAQIESVAKRLTLFIGGNDVRGIYGTVYDGESAGAFVADFLDDAAFVLDRVLDLNPAIEVVLVNVPHVGITPDVKGTWPPDPLKTGRVTELLRELNTGLAQLAAARNVGYADIFTPTLLMLGPEPFPIQGIAFANSGTTTGELDKIWLNGPLSANFHPNTNVQAVVANIIIEAFNRRYDSGIAVLGAEEILGGILGRTPEEIDMPFGDWLAAYGLEDFTESDDFDGDGMPLGVEFALGLNPLLPDAERVRTSLVGEGDGRALELRYPQRLAASARYTLRPAFAADLAEPFTPFTVLPEVEADGFLRAVLPLAGPRGFMRLEATLTP